MSGRHISFSLNITHTHTHTHTFSLTHTHTHSHALTHTHTRTHTHSHALTHTLTRTSIHEHTHTHALSLPPSSLYLSLSRRFSPPEAFASFVPLKDEFIYYINAIENGVSVCPPPLPLPLTPPLPFPCISFDCLSCNWLTLSTPFFAFARPVC